MLAFLGPDKYLGRWVVEHRVHALDRVFEWLSRIGSVGLVWIAIALVLTLLWRKPWIVVAVVLATVSANLVATLVKLAIPRHRPRVHQLVHGPKDHSFPSGHAATSFAGAFVLSVVAPRARIALFVLAAAIAFSRVYVGVHWPLDVVGGSLLGLAVGYAVLRAVRALPPRAAARLRAPQAQPRD